MALKDDIESNLVVNTDVTWSELDNIIGDSARIDENDNIIGLSPLDNKTDTEKYRIILLVDWAADYKNDEVQWGMDLQDINDETGLSLNSINDQYIEEVATDRYRIIPGEIGNLVDAMS